jgi:hypothetical protein
LNSHKKVELPRSRRPTQLSPRPGERVGAPATAYGNRSDLSKNKLPAQVATNQTYGQSSQEMDSLRRVPMGASPGSPGVAPPGGGPGAAPLPGPGGGGPSSTAPAPPPMAEPGSAGPFNRPTERPHEPVTTGLAIGAGAGPESLPRAQGPDQFQTLGGLLNQLGTGSAELRNLAGQLGAGRL